MWASLTFTSYAALYIILVLKQLDIDTNYLYNTSLKNILYGTKSAGGVDLMSVGSYDNLQAWLKEGFLNISSLYQEENGIPAYFINEVNYLVGGDMKMCFKLTKKIQNTPSYFSRDWDRSTEDETERF